MIKSNDVTPKVEHTNINIYVNKAIEEVYNENNKAYNPILPTRNRKKKLINKKSKIKIRPLRGRY